MTRCESAKMKFSCIAMTDIDTIYFINFPHQVAMS
jgi:hypothetical protein